MRTPNTEKELDIKLRLVTNYFVETYLLFEPWGVNRGNCFNWAYIACKLINDGAQLVSQVDEDGDVCIHAWVRYKGLYYDAEHLEGVIGLHTLAMYPYSDCKVCDPKRWIRGWRLNGRCNELLNDIDELREITAELKADFRRELSGKGYLPKKEYKQKKSFTLDSNDVIPYL